MLSFLPKRSLLHSDAAASPRKLWAFTPPEDSAIPEVRNVRAPIDAFVLAGLEAKNLQPAPSAGKRELIRRETFDLTGLPRVIKIFERIESTPVLMDARHEETFRQQRQFSSCSRLMV